MKRIIITNNKKVAEMLKGRAQVEYRDITALKILEEGRYTAQQGGRLLTDPTRISAKAYYRSLPFLMAEDGPDERSIQLIDQCIVAIGGNERFFSNEPFLAGIAQNKDAYIVNKVMG